MPVPAVVTAAAKAAKAVKAYRDRGGRLWWLIVPALLSVGAPGVRVHGPDADGGDDRRQR